MLNGSCHCGAVHWTLSQMPKAATACSCTICRRYGVLWAYGHLDHEIKVRGETRTYLRADGGEIAFHHCLTCGCVTHYVATAPRADGRHLAAVNLRLSEPDPIADIPIRHFDGLDTWKERPTDARRVRDHWY